MRRDTRGLWRSWRESEKRYKARYKANDKEESGIWDYPGKKEPETGAAGTAEDAKRNENIYSGSRRNDCHKIYFGRHFRAEMDVPAGE